MIYKNQLVKELGLNSFAIIFMLLIILFSVQFVNLLGQVTRGMISVNLIFNAMLASLAGLLPMVLCVGCFISVFKVLNRYWLDSEMIVWLTSGLALRKWISPVLLFSIPFALVLSFLTLYALPLMNAKNFEYTQALERQPNLDFLDSGVFTPAPNGIVFIESFDRQQGRLNYFFSHEVNPDNKKFEVTIARAGKIKLEKNGVQVTLDNVNRYIGYPNQADFSVFSSPKAVYYLHGVKKTQANPADAEKTTRMGSLSNRQLWLSSFPVAKAELMWRLVQPLSLVLLSLLAIPFSFTNNRSQKNYNMVWAIVLFFVYQNGLILLYNLITHGHLNFIVGLLFPIVFLGLLLKVAFIYRESPKARWVA